MVQFVSELGIGMLVMLCGMVKCLCEGGRRLWIVDQTVTVRPSAANGDCSTIRNSIFLNLVNRNWGGAFQVLGGSLDVSDSTFIGCMGDFEAGKGGAIFTRGTWTVAVRCCGIGCWSDYGNFWYGENANNALHIDDSSFVDCTCIGRTTQKNVLYGSVFWFQSDARMEIVRTNFSDCWSKNVPGVVNSQSNHNSNLPNALRFQTVLNVSGDGMYLMRNGAGSYFEFCSVVGCVARTTTLGVFRASHQGIVSISRCLVKGYGGPFFTSDASITVRIWNCFIDVAIPSSFAAVGQSEMIDNYGFYEDAITIARRGSGSCVVLYVVSEGGEEVAPGVGVLENNICTKNLMSYDGKTFGKDISGYDTAVSESGASGSCCKIRQCTFSELSSSDQNGGAVSFSATGTASAEFSASQFSLCYTSKSATDLRGGAIYVSVWRTKIDCICGTECISYYGTFISVKVETGGWFESYECSIYKCNTDGSFNNNGGGGAVDIVLGPFEIMSTNFSDIVQNSEAATILHRSLPSSKFPVLVTYMTCLRCQGASGISLDFEAGITFDKCMFMKNSVASSGGWFESIRSGLILDVRFCYFVNCEGPLFKSTSATLYADVYDCVFDQASFVTIIANVAVSFSNNLTPLNYMNTVTIEASPSHLCYRLYWLPSLPFTESVKLAVSSLFSETEDHSRSSRFSRTLGMSSTHLYSESADVRSTELFSMTEELSSTMEKSVSEDHSVSDYLNESRMISISGLFAGSSILELTQKLTQSGNILDTLKFSDSVVFSSSGGYSSSRVLDGTKSFSFSSKNDKTRFFSISASFEETDHVSRSSSPESTLSFSGSESYEETKSFSGTLTPLSQDSEGHSPRTDVVVPASTLPLASTLIPDETIPPVSTIPPAPTNPPVATASIAATRCHDQTLAPASTIHVDGTPLATVPPISTNVPVSTNFPEATGLPLETRSPEATIPLRSTIPAPSTLPPPSTFPLRSTIPPQSSFPTQSPFQGTVVASTVN
jgi:hypothetical protein